MSTHFLDTVFGNVVTITGSESSSDIGSAVAEQAAFFGYLALAALLLSVVRDYPQRFLRLPLDHYLFCADFFRIHVNTS